MVESCPDRPAGKTRDILARYVGLSGRSLDKIEAITKAAEENPERYGPIKDEMDRSGKSGRVNRLYLQLRHLQEADAAGQLNVVEDAEVHLHHCDFRQLRQHVRPGSARIVLADPPWDRDALALWPEIAECAASFLADDGLLVAFPPIMGLPDVIAALGYHLQYRWTLSLFRGDPCPLVKGTQIMNGWRPVLLYDKGHRHELRVRDALSYSRASWEKKYHPWEQNPDELLYLVEHLTGPGELVLDFFGGSFVAAVACRQLRRQYVGCDSDEGCVNIGRKRVTEVTVRAEVQDVPPD